MTTEYRLSWESLPSHFCADVEAKSGRGIWGALTPSEWDALPWREPTVKVTTDPWQQYNTLKEWSESHDQPIRNVRLEQREVPEPDLGWTEVHRG